jgi:YggT family protein
VIGYTAFVIDRRSAVSPSKDVPTTMSTQIAELLIFLLRILTFAIIGRALLSWFDPGGRWPISRVLHDVTEPIIAPIRQVIPSMGMFDISPIVALLLLQVLTRFLAQAML